MRSVFGFRINTLTGIERHMPECLARPALDVDKQRHSNLCQIRPPSVPQITLQSVQVASFVDCNPPLNSLALTIFAKKTLIIDQKNTFVWSKTATAAMQLTRR